MMDTSFFPSLAWLTARASGNAEREAALQMYIKLLADAPGNRWRFANKPVYDWKLLGAQADRFISNETCLRYDENNMLLSTRYTNHSNNMLAAFIKVVGAQTRVIRVQSKEEQTIILRSSDFSPFVEIAIVIEDYAQCVIIDELDHKGPVFRAITIHVGRYARCTIVHKQINHSSDRHLYNHMVVIAQGDSSVQILLINNSMQISHLWLHIRLVEPGANAVVRGAYRIGGTNQYNFVSEQQHDAPHTTSSLIMHGIVDDAAYASYEGSITIEQSAAGSCATQLNKVIMLSESARALSVPTLQVKTNDVICKHGSATAQLDRDTMIYLQARGISLEDSKRLLMRGFIDQVLDAESRSLLTIINATSLEELLNI
jgi:Fe-S cluster assembly scaffold protein SufB